MLTVVIQAGGRSSRMGRDKGLVPFLGRPLIERVMRRVKPIADELIVTTNRPEDYAFLGVPLFTDLKPGHGALGGLYTALASASLPLVAVVACDMPFASAPLLEAAAKVLDGDEADVVIAGSEDRLQPLHAVYRRATCLPAIESAIDAGVWKVIAWLPNVKVRVLNPEEVQQLDPLGLAFYNVNTPLELEKAERLALAND